MASKSFISLKGQKQGDIKGGITNKGKEGMIGVFSFSHDISSPRDPSSGLATGKRMHKPFIFTKEIDKASPLLMNVLTTNENLTEVNIHIYTQSPNPGVNIDSEVEVYKIKLTNASISDIQTSMHNILDPQEMKFPVLETISLTYQKIEWTWVNGGVTASDDWEARV